MRLYAWEFLFDLGDKRVLPIVQRVFPQVSEDGKYNLILGWRKFGGLVYPPRNAR